MPRYGARSIRIGWHSGVPYPKHHWRDFIAWIRHGTTDDYRRRKAEHIANGMNGTEAMHLAADEAINDLKHRTRQRRRVERRSAIGLGGHEELLRRYRLYQRIKAAVALPPGPERAAALHAARID